MVGRSPVKYVCIDIYIPRCLRVVIIVGFYAEEIFPHHDACPKLKMNLLELNLDSIGLRKLRLIGTNIVAFEAVAY